MDERETALTIGWILEKRDGPGKFNISKFRTKFKERLKKAYNLQPYKDYQVFGEPKDFSSNFIY
jgi:hypothetical protein